MKLTLTILVIILCSFLFLKDEKEKKIFLGDKEFSLFVADSDDERVKGLSGFNSLEKTEGMLFIFPEAGKHGFWMKEMNFPIDIIWLNSSCEISDIKENAKPESYPEIFYSEGLSKYVLEINAGLSAELKMKVGKKYEFCK